MYVLSKYIICRCADSPWQVKKELFGCRFAPTSREKYLEKVHDKWTLLNSNLKLADNEVKFFALALEIFKVDLEKATLGGGGGNILNTREVKFCQQFINQNWMAPKLLGNTV